MSTQYHSHKKRKDYDYEDLSISYDYGEIDNGCCCCRDSLLLLLLLSFFYKWKLLLKSRMFILVEINGSQSFKDIPYSCYWTPIFSIFFRYFLKQKQLVRIVETYLSISFPGQCKRIFCQVEIVFFGQCYFAASRNHY